MSNLFRTIIRLTLKQFLSSSTVLIMPKAHIPKHFISIQSTKAALCKNRIRKETQMYQKDLIIDIKQMIFLNNYF